MIIDIFDIRIEDINNSISLCMEKLARKPSADPAQERLRQDKATWNKEVSTFVNDLIHFKKMMNGWPSKFFKERSRLTAPIPADPATIVGSLAGDFQEIVNKGNGIIREQIEYSKNRRQKQPPKPQAVVPVEGAPPEAPKPNAAPDLAQQIGKQLASSEYYLISEASNPLTRFFHRLLSPGIGLSGEAARLRKYRMSLLDATLNTYKDLKKLQVQIVKSGAQSIFLSSKLLDKIEDNYVFLASGMLSFKEILPQGANDVGGQLSIPEDKEEKVSPATIEKEGPKDSATFLSENAPAFAALQDIQANSNSFKGVAGMPSLRTMAMKFFQAKTPEERDRAAAELLTTYQQTIVQLCANKQIPVQNSLAEILAHSTKNVVAQNMLGKLKHQISPFDKTSAFRLDIYKIAASCRKDCDKVMDLLEIGLDMAAIQPLIQKLGNDILKMRTMMQALNTTIKGQGYQSQFMGQLEKERNVGLDPKQKEQLNKLLQQKQMRELTKMYGR